MPHHHPFIYGDVHEGDFVLSDMINGTISNHYQNGILRTYFKIDDTIFINLWTDYMNDASLSFNQGEYGLTDFNIADYSWNASGYELDGNNLTVTDPAGRPRVVIGRQTEQGAYGIQVNDANASSIFKLWGNEADLCGWTLSTSSISKVSGANLIEMNASNEYFRVVHNSNTRVKMGKIGSDYGIQVYDSNGTDIVFSSVGAGASTIGGFIFNDDNFHTTIGGDNTVGMIVPADDTTKVFYAGADDAAGADAKYYMTRVGTGKIGTWLFELDGLKSAAEDSAKIRLDALNQRITTEDASNDTLTAQGYLGGLKRNNAIGTATSGTTSTLTDTDKDWHAGAEGTGEVPYPNGELFGLSLVVAFGSGSQTKTILSNTSDTITIEGTFDDSADVNTEAYYVTYPVNNYGFWAKQGERMAIDGDVIYESGDWLIQNNAALKFFDADGDVRLWLGDRGGTKGLYIGDDIPASGDTGITAQYLENSFKLGDVDGSSDYIKWDSTNGLVMSGSITIKNNSKFSEYFEDGITPTDTEWGYYYPTGGGEISISTDSFSGLHSLKIGLNDGTDGKWVIWGESIPYNPSKMYKMTIVAKQSHGSGTFYAGFTGRNQGDTAYISTAGGTTPSSSHYFAASGVDVPVDWTTYVGYVTGNEGTTNANGDGSSISSPYAMKTGVYWFRPMFIVNHDNVAGITYVDSIVVEEVDDSYASQIILDTNGMTLKDAAGTTLASYGTSIQLGKTADAHIDLTSTIMVFTDAGGNDQITMDNAGNATFASTITGGEFLTSAISNREYIHLSGANNRIHFYRDLNDDDSVTDRYMSMNDDLFAYSGSTFASGIAIRDVRLTEGAVSDAYHYGTIIIGEFPEGTPPGDGVYTSPGTKYLQLFRDQLIINEGGFGGGIKLIAEGFGDEGNIRRFLVDKSYGCIIDNLPVTISNYSIGEPGFNESTSGGRTKGYTLLPGGFIMQFGSQQMSTETTGVTFPITFPTKCIMVVASASRTGWTDSAESCSTDNMTASGVDITGYLNNSGGVIMDADWIAIGN